jgi:hypothetical protein
MVGVSVGLVLHNFAELYIIYSVPEAVGGHDDGLMGVNFEAGYFGLANDDFAVTLLHCVFGLEVAEGPRCRETTGEDSQGADDHIVLAVNFSDCGSLVDFAAGLGYAFLLIDVGWFVVLCYLVEFG